MIIVVMGVSGSGKSTVGQLLAEELNWAFYEGDEFHLPESVRKMAQGVPLTDADRASWLEALASLITKLDQTGKSAVITCSALKQAYRERLKKGAAVRFVYLRGTYDIVLERLESRQKHFMKPVLLRSQFDTLEEPTDTLVINITQSPEAIIARIRKALHLAAG